MVKNNSRVGSRNYNGSFEKQKFKNLETHIFDKQMKEKEVNKTT